MLRGQPEPDRRTSVHGRPTRVGDGGTTNSARPADLDPVGQPSCNDGTVVLGAALHAVAYGSPVGVVS